MVDTQARLAILRRTGLLAPLADPELEKLLGSCRERSLPAGEALCHEGEEGHAMYVVLSGHLVVSKGGKQVAVGSPGDVFGEMALIESRERAATLRALDDTLVLEIPEDAFRCHIAQNSDSLLALLKVFSDRARHDLEALASDNIKLQAYAQEVERANQELTQIRRQLEEKNRLLERLSALDTLTGISNRGRFDAVLRQEWRRAAREETALSLIFCDIDHFKRFNDTYGHQAGDDCLVRVAQSLDAALNRPADIAARYGGEEFVALLVDTDGGGARTIADRIRSAIDLLRIEHRSSSVVPWLTVSLGIATVRPDSSGRPEDLVKLADRACYAAKQSGRNRVVAADELPSDKGTPPPPGR
jgi:diguanylate cyclase (GGDEF)-like protein